jgi:TolB-like protein
MAAAAFSWWWLSPGSYAKAPERPRLLVQPFEDLTRTEASTAIARGLSQEIVGQLSKFRDIIVVESVVASPDGSVPLPRFTLGGSITLSDGAYRLRVRFTNQADGSVVWANSYDGAMDVGELLAAQTDIGRRVATTLAQSYGVISKADAAIQLDNPPDDWAAYSCTLAFYAYRTEVDVGRLPAVRDCLERAVARFPDYATAWGLLSQAYIDGMRFSYPFDPRTSPQTIDRALEAAKRAVELDPLNVRGLEAKMTALYFAKDIEGALEAGKRAMEINPNDVGLMKEYGSWLAQSGNWAEGCKLTEESVERNPSRMAYSEAALALCAYFTGSYEKAAVRIRRSPAVKNPTYHAMAAAFLAEAGHMEDAARERDWLETNAAAFIQNARAEASMRLLRDEDVDFFLSSLRKAGLKVED